MSRIGCVFSLPLQQRSLSYDVISRIQIVLEKVEIYVSALKMANIYVSRRRHCEACRDIIVFGWFSRRGVPLVDSCACGFRWAHVMAAHWQAKTRPDPQVRAVLQNEDSYCAPLPLMYLDYVAPQGFCKRRLSTRLGRSLPFQSRGTFVSTHRFVSRVLPTPQTKSRSSMHSGSLNLGSFSLQFTVSFGRRFYTRKSLRQTWSRQISEVLIEMRISFVGSNVVPPLSSRQTGSTWSWKPDASRLLLVASGCWWKGRNQNRPLFERVGRGCFAESL